MRFGIEIEEILHAGDVFAVDLGNTPHLLSRLFADFGG
jgi:hypothetical protein